MKLSEELKKAKAALQKREKLPGYKVNMMVFHHYQPESDVCHLCLAGAYMEEYFEIPRTQTRPCFSLNRERQEICTEISKVALQMPPLTYSDSPEQFYKGLDEEIEKLS